MSRIRESLHRHRDKKEQERLQKEGRVQPLANQSSAVAAPGAGFASTSTSTSRSVVAPASSEVIRETVTTVPSEVQVTTTVQPALKAVGEVYGSTMWEASHHLPVQSDLALVSNLPVEGSIPINASIPIEGDFPLRTQLPVEGIVRIRGVIPAEGILPVRGSIPISGQLPMHGDIPITGMMPIEGIIPISGQVPLSGAIPVHTAVPIVGDLPVNTSLPLGRAMGVAKVENFTEAWRTTEVRETLPMPATTVTTSTTTFAS